MNLGGTRPSEAVTDPSEGSVPEDPRAALREAIERVLEALSDPSSTRSDLLVSLLDLWVAESALVELLADDGNA
jgi:hypothetical protein